MEHIPFPLGYSPHQYRFLDKNGAPLATSGQLLAHQYGFGIAEWPENAQALEVCFSDGSLYRPRQEELVTICQYGGQHGSLLITDELRELPILTRLDAVVSSYKKRELIYNKERVIGELIQASGEHMYPFFEGLGVGDCKLLSYQLASTLNALNIPAVIARGQVADGLSRKQYITPGHRHVIAYAPHPIKLDPTLWCKYAFTIDPHHQALNATAEKLSQVGSPEEAYQLGKDLRRLIVVKGTPVNRSESNNGHLLNDDSDKVLTHPNENDGFYIYSPQELTHLHRKVSAKVKRLINAVSETYTYECGKFIDQLYGKHESYPVQCLKAYLQKRTDVPPRVLESGQLLYDTAQYYCLHCHNEESTDHIFERIIESQFSDCVVDTERDYQLIESYVHWQEGHQPEAIYGGLEYIIQLAAIRPNKHPALYKRVLTNYFQSLSFDLNDNSHHREEILLSLLEPNKILSSIIASTPDVVADEIQEIIMDFLQRETTIKELTGFGLYRGDTIETWIEFLRWNAERPEYQHLFDEDKKFSDAMCDIIRYGFFTIASHRSTQTWPTDTQRLTSTFNNLLTFEERVERKISLITTAEDKEDFATIYRRSMEHTPHHLSLYSEPTAKIALTLAGLTHEISLHYSGELVLLLAQERGAIDHATMMELWKEYRHPVEHPEDTKKSATDLMIFSLRQLIDTFYTSLPRLPITPASNELCYALVSAEREFIQNEDPALELFGNKDFGYVIDHSELSNYESDVISDFSHIYWTTDHKSLSTIRERALKGALAHIRSQLGPPKIIDTVRYLHAMLDTEEISETKITSKLQLFLESERRWTRHYDDAITLYEGITRSYPEPSNILFLDGNRRDIKLDPKDGGTLLSKLFSLIHTLRSPARFDANILEQKLLNNPPSQLKVHAIAKELNSDGIPQKRPGNGQEYLENRPYQQGDDVRHIDWRAFAKTDKYHTMVRTDESPQLASNNLHIQVDAASIPCHCDTPSQSLLTLMNYIYAGVRAGKEVNVTLYHEGTIIVDVRHTAVQELTSSKGSHSLLEFMHDFGHAVNSFTRDIREKFPHYKKLPFLNPPKSHPPSVRRDPRLQEAQPVLACTNKALERLREKGKNLKNHLFLRLPEEDVYTPTLSQLIDNIEEVEGLALEELKELIKGDRELHEKHSTEEISS